MAYKVVPDRQGIIQIGKIKENLVTEVELPAPGFGGGSYAVLLRRPKEEQPYPVAARHEGSTLIWTVQTADTAIAGTGKLECRWYGDNGEVAKSQTYMVRITDGLPDPTEAPEAWEGFMGQVARDAQAAQTAAGEAKANADGAAASAGIAQGAATEAGKLAGAAGNAANAAAAAASAATSAQAWAESAERNARAAAEAAETARSGAEAAKLSSVESATGAAGSAEAAAQAAQKGQALYEQVKADLAAGKLKGEKGDTGPAGPAGKDGLDAPQIDDAVVSAENPWSSRKIVETLCPPLEESGNPVTCEPVAGYPLGVVASWEPTQAGEGEPYPAGGGKNLFDINGKLEKSSGSFTVKDDTITFTNFPATDYFPFAGWVSVEANQDYIVSFSGKSLQSIYVYSDKLFGDLVAQAGEKDKYVFNSGEHTRLLVGLYSLASRRTGTSETVSRVQVEKGSTATAYAPYENIRPISGRDAVEATRCGENLLDVSRVAENKNCTVDGSTIHVVDTSGRGASYILLEGKYPAGTYTIQIDADTAKHGRFLLRGYDANGNIVDASILPYTVGYDTAYNAYYKSTLLYPYKPSGTHKVITFTVQGAAYFQVGLTGGISPDETSADLKNFALFPGSTPPTVYTPYRGDTLALALPSTIYGGEVDAVTGKGAETWKLVTLDGTEAWNSWGVDFRVNGHTGFYLYAVNDYNAAENASAISSHYKFSPGAYGGAQLGFGLADSKTKYLIISVANDALADTSSNDAAIKSFKAFLAAQYAAGTPVQIAYKLAEPVPFQATGNGPIMPLEGEINTVMTDADSVSVTGRADPIRIIQQLQAAQSAAAAQLDETQQAMVDTTAMAVDYIYEQDSKIFGGDDDDNETDTAATDVP